MENSDKIEVVICMGSSCFSRGNCKNLRVIEDFLKEHQCSSMFDITGNLCEEACSKGPNIKIDGKIYSEIEPISIPTILMYHLKNKNIKI